MKTIIKIFFAVALLFTLAGCGDKPPDLEDRIIEDAEGQASYTGTIETIEIDIYQDGTHKIKTDGGDIVIQSPKINLSNYLGKKVTVEGSMQKLIDNKSEVFTVGKIKLEEADESGVFNEYENKQFGFRFDYPDIWELFEDTNGITLRSNGFNWVAIDIFNTDSDLDDFVYFHEIEDGTPVTIGSQRSLRYIESDEIRIYSPNASKGKIYKITFQDSAEGSEAQKELFYSFLESFTILVSKVKEGEKCGGKENLTCPEDFRCELESGEEDAEGICVPVNDVSTGLDCPFIPAPSGCRNYEAKSFNKDGCPTSYECLDEPGLEPSSDSEEVSSESDEVVNTFTKYQDKILPEGAELLQMEIAEEQNLLAVVFILEDQKYRTLFSYEPSANEFNFVKKAHFEAGEERDWVIVEGEDIAFRFDKRIVKFGGSGSQPQIIGKDMRLYENPHKDFSLQYPKNWYYRSFGSIENTVWSVGFAGKPLDHISDAIISIVILDESSVGKKEMKGDPYLVEVGRDEDSHFLLEGPLEMKETVDEMAETIVQN